MTAQQPADSPFALLQESTGAANQAADFTWPAGVLKADAGGSEAPRAAAKSAGVLMADVRSAGASMRPAGKLTAAASSAGPAATDSALPGWPSWAGALPAVASPGGELGAAAAAARAMDSLPRVSTPSGRPVALGWGGAAALGPAVAARLLAGGGDGRPLLINATGPAVLSSAAGLSRSPTGEASDKERPQALPRAEGLGS